MAHTHTLVAAATLLVVSAAAPVYSQSGSGNMERPGAAGWTGMVRGGGIVQTDTDLDEGGSFQSTRFNIQAGQGYRWGYTDAVSLTLGYSYDGYDFSNGGDGLAARDPWSDINTISLSAPMRYGINRQWSAFLIPSVRSTGESGADFDDTLSGGVFTGVSYRFGDRLTIGPGVGVVGQIEDSATIFPVLIIDWKITDTISLETGRGLAATLGPGLTLTYKPHERWRFYAGGRYEKLRFRLDSSGTIPGGIGEDKSFPLYGGCSYTVGENTTINFLAGVELGGELRLEDEDGEKIADDSYDSVPFFGLTFNIRL